MWESIKRADPELYGSLEKELIRQRDHIELIASENFVSRAVLEAASTVLTNKYAEGYPGRRYYGGCQFVDEVESLAIERAKQLFNADHVNVQPHSGAQANMAVYFALLNPGDAVLGMSLSHGGHLTHGSPVNLSGKWFSFHHYGVAKDTEQIDYDEVRELALTIRPKLLVAGASAYPRVIHFDRLRQICDEAGCLLMVDMAHIAGLVAAGLHPSPIPYADVVTTTTHKTLRGPRGGMILCKAEHAKTIDKAVFPGSQGGPLMHIIAAKAVALKEALEPEFKDYQKKIVANAKVLAESLLNLGWRLVSGGTDNHLMLMDVTPDLTGKDAEKLLDSVGITANKNTIPFDTASPFVTSGIRLGTPAVTTRGMGEGEMREIAGLIDRALRGREEKILAEVSRERAELCRRFPLYAEL